MSSSVSEENDDSEGSREEKLDSKEEVEAPQSEPE